MLINIDGEIDQSWDRSAISGKTMKQNQRHGNEKCYYHLLK